jgi:ABC-type branched-subunit amino acid transport system substrate-binding protein
MLGRRKSWRGAVIGLGAVSLALAMSACSSGGSGSASSGNWTIGVLMPTTGPLSALGTQIVDSGPVVGDSALTLNVFTQAAGADALAKVPVYGTSIANVDGSEFLSTFASFAKKYGGYPQGEIAPAAWDAVHILAAALKVTSGKGGADLQKALDGMQGSSVSTHAAASD